MKTAAIYCRVSTEDQEREGTSLQTQLEACLKYCRDKGYDVAYRFSEAYSGLTLERPKLNELRELVRAGDIDIIVCYCLDRLSRDPGHGVILTQELEKHGVKLETVTETVDSTELGKLISYIRGFASKLEAEKIRERTMRGKKARAREGRMPGGSGTGIYGYDYIKVSQENGGRRVINEIEASWVRQMYQWLVNEGLSTNAITYRLRALNAPSKSGKIWNRRSVQAILKNPSYTGKYFAFTRAKGGKQFTRPQEDWIEIPGVTPTIISNELFETAQKQLQVNRDKSPRNVKYEYLLRGYIKCRQCNHAYVGGVNVAILKGKRYVRLYYRCSGKPLITNPVDRCQNKGWSAKRLEALVWAELERVLSHPEIIITELEKQRQDADRAGVLETELKEAERQLKAADREQQQLLQWALKGFPESQVEVENRRINKAREALQARKAELEAQLKASQDAVISIPKLEHTVELLRQQLKDPDFATKRDFIEGMGVKVWLDDESVEITGFIPTEEVAIVHTQSTPDTLRTAGPTLNVAPILSK
jgi:site-specific DNA recombinase